MQAWLRTLVTPWDGPGKETDFSLLAWGAWLDLFVQVLVCLLKGRPVSFSGV